KAKQPLPEAATAVERGPGYVCGEKAKRCSPQDCPWNSAKRMLVNFAGVRLNSDRSADGLSDANGNHPCFDSRQTCACRRRWSSLLRERQRWSRSVSLCRDDFQRGKFLHRPKRKDRDVVRGLRRF